MPDKSRFLHDPARGAVIVAEAPQARRWAEETQIARAGRAFGVETAHIALSPLDKPIIRKVVMKTPACGKTEQTT